jgi:hypothetical protein
MIRNRETLLAGPNFYSQNPVDELKKKELFEGLKYVAESRVGRIKKSKLVRNVKKSRIAKKITKTKITGKIKKAVGKLRKKIRRK